jgi:two-component system phosphate regulon sensor histidine kinase PhoR
LAEADRLAQMVNELGELSRIESGQVPLVKTSVSIIDVVHQVVERLHLQAERAGLSIVVSAGNDLPRVMADADRIGQVLVNIVHNAIKFTPAGGRITISARAEGGNMLVSVADTGIGIDSDDLPRVFERFYKADKSRSGGGTGLGLAIAKHILQLHGGEIRAESQPGKGSTFTFSLPLSA